MKCQHWQLNERGDVMKYLLRLLVVFMMGSAYAQSNLPACPSSGIFNNCFGTQTYSSGHSYVGEWKDGIRYGQGTFTFVSGAEYVGGWKHDRRNGQGTETYRGNKYVGEYKDDMKNGQGTFTDEKGNKYVGEFKDDMKNGQGTFTFADGNKYVGEYKNDLKNGQGTFSVANNNKYVGEFEDDKLNGKGTLYAPNGSIIEQGIWADNKFIRSASIQQATAPNQEIERLRAEAEEAKRKQAELAYGQRSENKSIRERNASINWQLEAQGKQFHNMWCQVTNITSQGRNSVGEAKFWLNVSCRTRQGLSGSSGGFEVFCGVHLQQVVQNSMFTAVCNGS